MEQQGYYKFLNGEWVMAVNGIILPNTTEPTKDPEVLEKEGWIWLDSTPTEILDQQ